MLEKLKKLNPEIELYDVNNKEFAPFGRIIKSLDATEIIETAQKIPNPESGSSYLPSVEDFEVLKIASAVCVMGLLTGCVTRSIDFVQESADYEVTQGRSGEIGREVLENENDQKVSVAIITENPNKADKTAKMLDKYVFDNLDVAITNLGKFEVVPRSELAAIINESRVQTILNNQTVALPNTAPRYLIIYNIVYSNFESKLVNVIDQGRLADETRKAMAIQDPIQKSIALAGVKAKATKQQ